MIQAVMADCDRRSFLGMSVLLFSLPSTQAVSLADFMELSQRLLQRAKVDAETAQIYLNALLSDRDSAVHLATLVESSGNPTPEQRELSNTIIEWWYTGTYEVGGQARLATHAGALMWDAIETPAPGTCPAPFGAWAKPPRSLA